jgi:hypothetical protein
MKLPRMRFTVRRLMIAVAVVGLVYGAFTMWMRSQRFSEKAANHARIEVWYQALVEGLSPSLTPTEEKIRSCREIAARSRSLRQKYELAARCPWLSVEPDPPEQ